MRTLVLACSLFLSACLSFASADPPPVYKDLMPDALDATIALVAPELGIYCAGVVAEGLVWTADHCLEPEDDIVFAKTFKGEDWNLEVLDRVPEQDLAVLRGIDFELPRGMSIGRAPKRGQQIIVIGHPSGRLHWSVTTGIVSHPNRQGAFDPRHHWIQIDAGVWYGNSGGPVFTRHGELVGIVSFFAGSPHLAGATHPDELRKVLDHIYKSGD